MSVLLYGQICRIKNGYQDWKGGYLDSCGNADCGDNLYEVSTSKSFDRAQGTGSWKIVSATGKKDGEPVMANDLIHLQNQYGEQGYLDTCGNASCGGNLYKVSVAKTPTRAAGTGTWKIMPEHAGEVQEDEVVHLQNGYDNWNGGFLDTCGHADCGGNLYEVSTSGKWNRDGLTTQWQLHEQ
jgi:hypothetical protein